MESLWCAGILLLQWQGEKFAHRQHLKFRRFHPVHCASKNPISPKVFKRSSNSSPHIEDVEGGHLGGKFQVRRYFTFAMARRKLCASKTFENLPLSTCTLCQQKSYTSKGILPIFEILPGVEDVEVGHLDVKFQVRRYFNFECQRENFGHRQHLKFCHFHPVHCASKIPISPKVFNRFSNSSPHIEDVEGGHLGGKFHVRRYFTFAMPTSKLWTSTIF